MEIIQTVPIPPNVEYSIDAAFELDEIDAGTQLACKLYAPRTTLMAINDEPHEDAGWASARRRFCASLTKLADEIIADLPPARRAALGLASLSHMRGQVLRTAWFYGVSAYEDTVIGGCLEHFRSPGNRQERDRMWRYELSSKQRRRLYGPNWIRRYVKLNDDTPRLRKIATRLLSRAWPINIEDAKPEYDVLMADIDRQIMAYRIENDRRIRDYLTSAEVAAAVPIASPSVRMKAKGKRFLAQRRKVIKRAASTAVAVLGPEAVSNFAHGRPVVFKGETMQLAVERFGSSAMMGHSGISVKALGHDGAHLASMCVYYEKTPALDQLTALGLSMMAGEEAEIVQTANLSRVSDAGYAHPLIGAKVSRPKSTEGQTTIVDGGTGRVVFHGHPTRNSNTYAYQRQVNEAYWRETRPIWLEATGVATMGRVWGVLDRSLGPLPAGSGHQYD